MVHLLTLVSLFLLSSTKAVVASPCVAFDINWNLLAFGLGGKDWNAGTQDTWASGSASDITASGRPPFDAANTTCYLSQFTNAIYVLNADSANIDSVYLYDATAKSWSTQSVAVGTFDPTNFKAILDHDTNIFYALSNGELFSLDMSLLKAANSTPIPWLDQKAAGFTTTGYQPVMALAENHIHFLDVPGVAAGSAQIFVIHFSYFQPEPQSYGNFPATHGQATSFFLDSGVQQEFAFIPDDGSATYVINAVSNTTQTLVGPSTKDPQASYFGGVTALVQLSSTGAVSFLPYNSNDTSANQAASWSSVKSLASVAPAGSSSSKTPSPTGSKSASGTLQGGQATGSSTSSGHSSGSVSTKKVTIGLSSAVALGIFAFCLA